MYFLDVGDLWKIEHLENLRFGQKSVVLKDVGRYDIWPDETGIVTYSRREGREARIEFNFIDRLKEVVPPI